jgi:hypothetical protein
MHATLPAVSCRRQIDSHTDLLLLPILRYSRRKDGANSNFGQNSTEKHPNDHHKLHGQSKEARNELCSAVSNLILNPKTLNPKPSYFTNQHKAHTTLSQTKTGTSLDHPLSISPLLPLRFTPHLVRLRPSPPRPPSPPPPPLAHPSHPPSRPPLLPPPLPPLTSCSTYQKHPQPSPAAP